MSATKRRQERQNYGHEATPSTAMGHIAIQESLNGNPVIWMERASDE